MSWLEFIYIWGDSMGMMVEVENEAVIRLEMVWVSNGCDVVEYYYLIQQVDVCVLSFFGQMV